MTPLHLRPQPRLEARLRQRIGCGLSYPFTLQEEAGEIQLRLAPDEAPRTATQAFRCSAGTLWLSHADALCGLLSACPLLTEPGESADWYWPLFNQMLSAPVQALFGELMPDPATPPAQGLWLEIAVVLGEARAAGQLCLAPGVLMTLLQRPGWRALRAQALDEVPLTLPVKLGTLSFAPLQLRSLRPDDVLFPATSYFSPTGRGALRLAQMQLEGELLFEEGHAARFHITCLENTYVNVTPEDQALDDIPQPGSATNDAAQAAASPFDSLPLALTVRCGHLKLTFGELSRLDVGSTVTVENVVPGEALLCHGEFPLAKGELVDVEGRLGLQITHMLPGVASLMDASR